MAGRCNKCGQDCIFKEPKNAGEMFGFPCDFCKRVMCRTCSGIGSTEIRTLILSTRALPYICKECVTGFKTALTLSTRVSALEDALVEIRANSTQLLENFEKQVTEISVEVRNMRASFISSLEDIKEDLKIIKENSSGVSAKTNSIDIERAVTAQGNNTNSVLYEMGERQKRSCNLMVFNLPEPTDKNTNEDLTKAKSLLEGLVGSPVDILKLTRIGKPNKNGHRSLRLTLQSNEDVLRLLRNKRKLNRSQAVFIEADLTSGQRNELNSLKAELRRRQQDGEVGLSLRYVNGIPKLVSKN